MEKNNSKMVLEEVRKGAWTEEEDLQLVCFVGLFGDRRWDFIAKVSGLKRTGKSCRLRWVNYLHPGLKRGKMTPHEEKLVLELHSQFGNRWSKIARRLPGRTDNEIKNYWRTHMRKKAQEQKRAVSPSSSSSNCCSSSSSNLPRYSKAEQKNTERKFYETGGIERLVTEGKKIQPNEIVCSMDDIWRDITSSSDEPIKTAKEEETVCSMDEIWEGITSFADESIETVHDDVYCESAHYSSHSIASFWDFFPDNPWKVDEEAKILLSSDDELLFPLMNPKYGL